MANGGLEEYERASIVRPREVAGDSAINVGFGIKFAFGNVKVPEAKSWIEVTAENEIFRSCGNSWKKFP